MTFGATLILLGVLIVIMPALLAYFVAAAVIMAGASLIASGWRRRKFVSSGASQMHVDYVEM